MQCARIYAARQPSPRGGLSVQMDSVYINGEPATGPCSFECRRTSSSPHSLGGPECTHRAKVRFATALASGREGPRSLVARPLCAIWPGKPIARTGLGVAPIAARRTTRPPAVGLVADAGVEARGERRDSRPREPLRERQNVGNRLQHVRWRFEPRERGLWLTGGPYQAAAPPRSNNLGRQSANRRSTSPKPCRAPGQRSDPTQCPTSPIPPGGIEPPLRA